MKKTWRVLPFLAVAVLFTRCSCDFFGTTGAILIPEAKEAELGASFDAALRGTPEGKAEYPIFVPANQAQTDFQNYVNGVFNKVLTAVPKDHLPGYGFKFTLIDKDVANAFAVPGGYVYIYTGIIKTMRDESELAGVLGHEIAHVTGHHYREALARSSGLSLLVDVLLGNDAGALAKIVAGSLVQLATLKVSRGNEADADYNGTHYTGNAGRNPLGIAKYFGRAEDGGFSWASSHPGADSRVESVTKEVNSTPTLKALAADSLTTNFTADFLARVAAIK